MMADTAKWVYSTSFPTFRTGSLHLGNFWLFARSTGFLKESKAIEPTYNNFLSAKVLSSYNLLS